MIKFITKVTVTGADDSIDQDDLIPIQIEYPFVEFGILLSSSSMGHPRFPSKEWLRDLINVNDSFKLNLSGHLCGKWVRAILNGWWPCHELLNISLRLPSIFQRWQINTHAQHHRFENHGVFNMLKVMALNKQFVIFQSDGVNNDLLSLAIDCESGNVQTLFDLSHGAGLLPESWPKIIPGIPCGYAGGLSPENVASQIEKIIPLVGENKIWIDAETKLRSGDDLTFDLNKVKAFLKAARPYVI